MMLVQEENRLALPLVDIIDDLPVGLVLLNADGIVTFVNRIGQTLLSQDCLGLSWRLVIQSVFSPKADDGHEVSMVDGRRVHVSISPLQNHPGQVVTLIDLTQSRAYEKAQAENKRMSLLGQMTAQLAHQIRTPLASARLFCDQLNQSIAPNTKQASSLNRILACHGSIEQQIQALLLFAKGENLVKTRVKLATWIKELTLRAEAITNECQFIVTIDPNLQDYYFYMNEEGLLGAFLNLIHNAIEAEASKIHLEFCQLPPHVIQSKAWDFPDLAQQYSQEVPRCNRDDTWGGQDDVSLFVRLTDNGCGIPDDTKQSVFEAFYTTKANGTGLGLAVVNAVIKSHGGHIDMQSEVNVGTVVTMTFKEECHE